MCNEAQIQRRPVTISLIHAFADYAQVDALRAYDPTTGVNKDTCTTRRAWAPN